MPGPTSNTCGDIAQNGFDPHNHKDCIRHVKSAIRARGGEGLRLTPVRQEVLDILLESHAALGAYAILERLKSSTSAKQPPIVYRALDYLAGVGLVHKIEKLNAFVACTHPHGDHSPTFLVCTDCQLVAEHHETDADRGYQKTATAIGFQISDTVTEVLGTCATCAQKEAADAHP